MEERDGEKRSRIGPKLVYLDTELLARIQGIRRPEDPDEQEYMAHVAFWEEILGVHPHGWKRGNTDNVSESNRSLLEDALKNAAKYKKENNKYYKKILKLNIMGMGPFSFVDILPRSPSPRCFHLWHRDFRMTNMNPSNAESRRFAKPAAAACEYVSSELLQFFSMRFAGDFSPGQRVSIYGFMAVRDEVDSLRNYIFNRSRDQPQEITADSPDLSFIPPARGIAAPDEVIVEYSLKVVKGNDNGGDDDDEELIDGCFLFKEWITEEIVTRKVRLFSLLGPLDIRFVFMRFAVEATVEVKVNRAMAGYCLSLVTAATCGYLDEITLYDYMLAAPPRGKEKNKADGGELSAPAVAVAHAVVAVELGCNVKLRFEIASGSHGRRSSHELLLTARRHGSSKGAVVMGRMFKVAAKVTWSTMGRRFHPIFHGDKRALLGDPGGSLSFRIEDGRCKCVIWESASV